jgi:lipopolysaccharide assembly outer membrane protein LptD (OstA)
LHIQSYKSTFLRLLYLFLVHFLVYTQVLCQNVVGDTIIGKKRPILNGLQDSTVIVTNVDTVDIVFDDGNIDGPINYHAADSIVYDMKNQKLYLYGNAYMKYTDIEMTSEEIEYDWTSGTLVSRGKMDENGKLESPAKFSEKSGEYEADSMQYNFKTKKGRTFDVVTEQDGAYIHSEIVQKNEFDEWYGFKTKYTTCNNKEHPHFYLGAKKSKVIPGKVMVTGPVNLVVADVPTPLYLPFGIFPTKTGRRSGIIMPTYGEQPSLGFFLKDGGYFWAVNDQLSLTFLGEVYTRGRFGLSVNANYRKLYKYNGSLMLQYFRTPPNDRFVDNTGLNNDFSIDWNHTMDGKARPNNTFSASVNGRTSGYNSNSLEVTEKLLEVQVNSNLNYTRRLSKINSSFQISARHNQNFANNSISITLPELSFNASRFTPFQRKIKTDKKAFYEKIGLVYTARTKAAVSTIDSILFTKESLDKIQVGFIQTATLDIPFNLFKFFVIKPSFSYNERWYFKEETKFYEANTQTVGSSINNGFQGVRDFSFNTSISTTVTGLYNFKTKRLKAIRHVIKPTVNYALRPDFGKEKWGYYDSYVNEETGREVEYSKYAFLNNLYGTPGQGLQNLVSFNLRNNFEMKVIDRKDTLGGMKKIPLLEQFNVGTGYDFTADSLKVRPLVFSAQSRMFNNLISWNVGASFDPYALNDNRVKVNSTYFSTNKRLLRFDNAFASVQLNLKGKSTNDAQVNPDYGTVDERSYIANNPNLFYDFNVPWSLSVGYRMNITKGIAGNIDSTLITANVLTFGGHINITPKWQMNVTSGFDIRNKAITLTNVRVERDLHCWVLAFNWTAFPVERQTYAIELHVKSPILQELKLSRKQPPGTTTSVF